MNWRTDKPTADIIVAKLNNGNYSILERLSSGKYCVQDKSIGYDILHGENMVFIYEEEIQKWADLEEEETDCKDCEGRWLPITCDSMIRLGICNKNKKEDETVTDCDELEEEIERYIAPIHADEIKYEPFTSIEKCARHFAKWGAEHLKK